MRSAYVVAYDIADPRRLRHVYRTLRGWGEHVQLSVFRCDLDERETFELRTALDEILEHYEDQVLFIRLGPADGTIADAIWSLGRPYRLPEQRAVVV